MGIYFNMNTQKAIETVLWVVQQGEDNLYNIMKILFAAEKYHLNRYGRPITGDRYIAMPFGTVPSWIYDATKLKSQGFGFYKCENSIIAERAPVDNYFSESDKEALQFGYDEYAGKTFNEVKEKNHKEPAWVKANENYQNGGSADIAFEDIIEEDWLREELEFLAPTIVL